MRIPNRTKRLKLAPKWISTYMGKNPVRGYARHFSVDLICAITEMRMSGYPVDEEYELAVKRSIADRSLQKKMKREAKEAKANPPVDFCDGEFAFIPGYANRGAPYGIRWKEKEDPDFTLE